MTYESTDGTKIQSFLTLPADSDPKDLPLIVYPHGGPQARDWLSFDPFAQYWASRGYAVFQPNFRGSTGYGRKFEEAGYQQYGDKIIEDIASGIRTLIDKGYVDKDRICAAGGSFGGYAALALSAFESGLIKCAVSINGLTDLPLHIETKLQSVNDRDMRAEFREYYDKTLGNIDTQRDLLERHSPVYSASDIDVPVLLIHAEDDDNVDIVQSEIMNKALVNARKDVRFVRLKRAGHNLNLGDATRRVLLETSVFFAEHL